MGGPADIHDTVRDLLDQESENNVYVVTVERKKEYAVTALSPEEAVIQALQQDTDLEPVEDDVTVTAALAEEEDEEVDNADA